MAVFAGILNTHPPDSYDPTHELTQAAFDSLLWKDLISTAHGHSWFPESRGPGVVYAAVDTRGHYLRVAIRFVPNQLQIQMEESRNLLEGDGKIHKKVPAWIANLEEHIRRELGRMSLLGHPSPPSASSHE